jgi:hypothetical protein
MLAHKKQKSQRASNVVSSSLSPRQLQPDSTEEELAKFKEHFSKLRKSKKQYGLLKA